MKRKLCIIALVTAAVLGGCSTDVPDLSNVDNNIAAQYVADALLRNDKHYDESLDYDHSVLKATPTPMPTEAPTPTPEEKSEPAGTNGVGVNDGKGSEEGQSISNVSLSEIYGIPGVTIKQTSYEVKDTYGTEDYAVVTPQKKGNRLVVVHFRIANGNDSAKKVNLAGQKVSAELYINGESVGTPLLSIAEGDLQTYNGKISAGKKKPGVLLFEIDKSVKISSVEVKFVKGDKQASAAVH